MVRTHIRNIDWLIAWDPEAQAHSYIRNADLVFEGDRILHAGSGYVPVPGDGARVIDGSGYMVSPGLVDIHSHPSSEPMNKGFTDETGSPGLYASGLYEYMPTFGPDAEAGSWPAALALSELLMSGVTTLVDLSPRYDGWIEVTAQSGIRGCLAPMFRSAVWYTRNGHLVEYDWDEDKGFRDMEAALGVIDAAIGHPSGRLSGMVSPSQIDTCTPALLQETRRIARERGLPWTLHAAQSVSEFHEITRRHGVTPVRWLEDLGLLDGGAIIGHGIFLDDHPNTRWSTREDLAILARSGASVAHCPTVFQRRGIGLQDIGRYLDAGINIGLGTDTYPHNMIEEMRHAIHVGRMTSGSPFTFKTTDVFNAATIGGAKALGREDIGRLAPGAKADLFMVDLNHPAMSPVRDPLRSLIYAAAERAVSHVFVDGLPVVENHQVLTIDHRRAAAEVTAASRRAEVRVPSRDRVAGRSGVALSPLSFPEG